MTSHKKLSKKSTAGFTLIEMLFYILFVAFIIGGALGVVHQLLRNSNNLNIGISVEEEGNFILKKISWAINDSDIVTPILGSTSDSLSVLKIGGGTVDMDLYGSGVRIDSGSGFKRLSNDRFIISDLSFNHALDGTDPDTEYIKASFNIGSRSFEITRKIR